MDARVDDRRCMAGLRSSVGDDVVTRLRTFFDEYRATFARLNRDALVEFFTFPLHVVSAGDDEVVTSVSDRDAWPSVLDGLLGAYRSLGVVVAEPLELEVAGVARQLWSARVRWQLRRIDGSAVYDFTAIYTVVEIGGALRIAGIAHDELPKLQAAVAGDRDGVSDTGLAGPDRRRPVAGSHES